MLDASRSIQDLGDLFSHLAGLPNGGAASTGGGPLPSSFPKLYKFTLVRLHFQTPFLRQLLWVRWRGGHGRHPSAVSKGLGASCAAPG